MHLRTGKRRDMWHGRATVQVFHRHIAAGLQGAVCIQGTARLTEEAWLTELGERAERHGGVRHAWALR